MESRRLEKISDAYHHELARFVRYDLEDPKLQGVRITKVRLSPDLSLARVNFDMPLTPERKAEAMKALKRSGGVIRHHLAKAVNIKRTPRIEFYYDETEDVEKTVEELFSEIEKEGKK